SLNVAERARYRERALTGHHVQPDPRTLVAVLVGIERVVPAAEMLRRSAAADDILRARIGDGLFHLVTEHDREPVELALGAAVDGVLPAHVRPARVDRQLVGDVAVSDPLLNAVIDVAFQAGPGVVMERAVTL